MGLALTSTLSPLPNPTEPNLFLDCCPIVRLQLRQLEKDYDKSEDDIKALQSVGQIIGELVTQLDDERCKPRLAREATHHSANLLTSCD